MALESRKNPVFGFRLGLGLLGLALALGLVLRNRAFVPESFGDPASGFLYGIAIGTLLFALVTKFRLARKVR